MIDRFKVLQPGDRVAILSPASFPTSEQVDATAETLRSWGLVPVLGDHVLDRHGYMAGSDAARLADINRAIQDPAIRAIIATRGGAGAYRIADQMDFATLSADPKPIVGYSDISYLHLSAALRSRTPSIHGCLADPLAVDTTRQLLMTTTPSVLLSDPEAQSAAIKQDGTATGPLIGGNLAALATSVGVRLPDLAGHILFIEAQRAVGLGTVDRQLTQLIASGALDNLAAIALGSFEGFAGYNDRGWNLSDVLADRLLPLGIPIIGGLPAGHDLPEQAALPLGTTAHLHTATESLVIEPPSLGDPETAMQRFATVDWDQIVQEITTRPGPTRLVAVDGPGGSGKSTFAQLLSRACDDAPVVHTDDFASADNPIDWWPRLLDQLIRPLGQGKPARYQRYDWPSEQLAEWHEIDPRAPIVIIEGVSSGRSEWSDHLSYTIWIDTPRHLRLSRAVERDGQKALTDWAQWMSAEDQHYATNRNKDSADLIVDGTR